MEPLDLARNLAKQTLPTCTLDDFHSLATLKPSCVSGLYSDEAPPYFFLTLCYPYVKVTIDTPTPSNPPVWKAASCARSSFYRRTSASHLRHSISMLRKEITTRLDTLDADLALIEQASAASKDSSPDQARP